MSNAERQPITLGGLRFCVFHAPYSADDLNRNYGVEEKANNGQFKENWDNNRSLAFNNSVTRLLHGDEHEINLTGVVFPTKFDCNGINLSTTSFNDCRFSGGNVNFGNAVFNGLSTSFDNAQFFWGAYFNGCRFSHSASFNASYFHHGASFRASQFEGSTTFKGSEFLGHCTFEDAMFSTFMDFTDAKFRKLADFGVTIHKSEPATAFGSVTFRRAQFEETTNFANRHFLDRIDFFDSIFGSAPEFHGCTLHQDTTFPPIENFKDTSSATAERAYRTLRLAMKQQEAHEEEAIFWALEQRSKRSKLNLNRPKDWFPLLLSWGYDLVSEYGLNATRPLGWLICWLLLYGLLVYDNLNEKAACWKSHVHAEQWLANPGKTFLREIWGSCEQIISFSIAQSARPFFIWGDYGGTDITTALGASAFEFWVKVAATFDSAVSLTLVALFILAVRRRFRMQ